MMVQGGTHQLALLLGDAILSVFASRSVTEAVWIRRGTLRIIQVALLESKRI